MTLADARAKAGKAAHSKSAPNDKTMGELLREFYQHKLDADYRRPHLLKGYIDRLEKTEPALWNTKLRDIEQADIFRALTRYKKRGKVAAARLTSILKTVFRYATGGPGYLSTSPIASLSTELVAGKAPPSRTRVLTDAEIKALWHSDGPHTPLFQFLMLTGQRIGEARGATWDNIVGDVWNIPVENSKNKKAHWVPLPSAVLDIINAQDRDRRKIFSHGSSDHIPQAWLARWCIREKIEPPFTPHDLRRTFATRVNGMGVDPHIVERMLNHSFRGVAGIYNRADYKNERIEASNKWADEVARLIA
jgi:integrase